MSGFGCASAAFTQSVETTYAGEDASTPAGLATTTTPTQTFETVQGEASTLSMSTSSGSSSTTPSTTSTSTHLSGGGIAGIVVGGVIVLAMIFFAYRYFTQDGRAARQRERDEHRTERNRLNLEEIAMRTPSGFRYPPHRSNSPSGQAAPGELSSSYDGSTVVGQGLHDLPSNNNSRPSRPSPSILNPMPMQPTANHYSPMSPSSDTSRPPRAPPSHS